METDRHGYCAHNRKPPKCWECQVVRALTAEGRVAELRVDVSNGFWAADQVTELQAQLQAANAKIEELEACLDTAHGAWTDINRVAADDSFPWMEFLDARARLIVFFRKGGNTWEQVVAQLSCEVGQVQRIFQHRTSGPTK